MQAELPRHVDSTMISCFRTCPRKFWLEFCLGLRPAAVSVDLHAGGVFASTIEFVQRAVHEDKLPLQEALLRAYPYFLTEWGDFEPRKETAKTPSNVWAAVESYFRKYSPLTDEVQPFFIDGKPTLEFTFAIPLEPATKSLDFTPEGSLPGVFPLHPSGEPFLYAGRLDRLGQLGTRNVWVDEKTGSRLESTWAEQWDLRSQFIGYTWACQQSGIKLDTGVIRGIIFYKAKECALPEAVKQYSDFLIARWYEQLRRDLWRMRRMWDEGHFDFNLAEACTMYGGCSFKDVCISQNEASWMANYEVRRWDPLRKNPITEVANAAPSS